MQFIKGIFEAIFEWVNEFNPLRILTDEEIINKWKVQENNILLNWKSYDILKNKLQNALQVILWQTVPRGEVWPSKRYQNTSTTIGTKIYLIGGQESNVVRFNDIYEFDTVKGTSQPPSFSRHVAAGIGKQIFVHGGYDGNGTYFGVLIFDTEEKTWTNIETSGDTPCARTNHAGVAIGDKLYIFGGIIRTGNNGELKELNDMYVLDTATLEWKEIRCPNMPDPRIGHKMVSIRNKIYLFGGSFGENLPKMYNDVHIYDPETKDWICITGPAIVDASTFCSMFSLGPFIFIFGGQVKGLLGKLSDDVYCFDSLSLSWHKTYPQSFKPAPRDMTTMSVCGNKAFLFNGYDTNFSCLDDVHFLYLTKEANEALENLEEQQIMV